MAHKASILVIEDERDIRDILVYNLEREGYSVTAFDTAEKGITLLLREIPDIILLDMMLPGMDGFEALKKIRSEKKTAAIPVIMVTARTEDADIVAALELGADDYICKPFSPRVLVARVRARLREIGAEDQSNEDEECIFSSNGIILNTASHAVFINDTQVNLSATEFALLAFFMGNAGRVFSRQRLIDAIHGSGYPVTDRSVDVQILALRRKMGASGELIETVRGVGYRYKEKGSA